jgi:hypothetical protein
VGTQIDILDSDWLLAQAKSAIGLDDYGDETFRARFRLATAYLQSLKMDEAGQRAAASVCLGFLASRLQFFADFKRYPIGEEKIEKPLFATGEARGGTTLMHALLAVDPNGRALRFSEVMNPSPPPGVCGPNDPRYAKADDDWRDILKRLPFWLVSHPYNDMLGNGIPECERTWGFDFRQMTPTGWWRVPMGMNVGNLPQDAAAQIRIHKMMLQAFQYKRPKKYWVLKGFHKARLKELFDAYPDAQIVWTHRDPVQSLASGIVMSGQLVEGMRGWVDWKEEARKRTERIKIGIQETLDSPWLNDPRIHHVRYQDFVADPVGTIGKFYEKAGVRFGPEVEGAMRGYLKTNKADRYGKFKYSTDIINADIDALHRDFAPYRERFDLGIEKRG